MKQNKELQKVAKYHNDIVIKNQWMFSENSTLNQQKIMHFIVIQEKNNINLNGMRWTELVKEMNIIGGETWSLKRKKHFLQEIASTKLGIVIDENNMEFRPIFSSIGLRYNKLCYELNSKVESLFDEPDKNYYLMNPDSIKNLSKTYSLRLYELLNEELSSNEKETLVFAYDFIKLKEYLGLAKSKYIPSTFIRDVINPSLIEINDHTDINIAGEFDDFKKKILLASKKYNEDVIYIKGISRKKTVEEYMQDKQNEYESKVEEGRTKVTIDETHGSIQLTAAEMSIDDLEKILAARKAEQKQLEQDDSEEINEYLPKDSKLTKPEQPKIEETNNDKPELTKEKISEINTKVKNKNDYDGKLLKLLEQAKNNEFEISIADLKTELNAPKSYDASRLKIRVIADAIQEISKIDGYENLTFEDVKNDQNVKNKITGFKFIWNKNVSRTIEVEAIDFNDETL